METVLLGLGYYYLRLLFDALSLHFSFACAGIREVSFRLGEVNFLVFLLFTIVNVSNRLPLCGIKDLALVLSYFLLTSICLFIKMFVWMEWVLDPSLWLCIGAIVAPVYINQKRLRREQVKEYFMDPFLLLVVALIPICGIIGFLLRKRYLSVQARRKALQDQNKSLHAYQRVNYPYLMRPLRCGERMRARWYLLNALIIHAYLDGGAGFFKHNDLLTASYGKIDRRYAAAVGSFQGSAVHILSLFECCVLAPLCLWLYFTFQLRSPVRDPLELVVCVMQVFGTVMYLGQEAISGARNLDLDYFFTLSQYYVVYFWLPIVLGSALFLVVPIYLASRSIRRLSNQVMFYQRHHYTRHTLDHVTPPVQAVPAIKS